MRLTRRDWGAVEIADFADAAKIAKNDSALRKAGSSFRARAPLGEITNAGGKQKTPAGGAVVELPSKQILLVQSDHLTEERPHNATCPAPYQKEPLNPAKEDSCDAHVAQTALPSSNFPLIHHSKMETEEDGSCGPPSVQPNLKMADEVDRCAEQKSKSTSIEDTPDLKNKVKSTAKKGNKRTNDADAATEKSLPPVTETKRRSTRSSSSVPAKKVLAAPPKKDAAPSKKVAASPLKAAGRNNAGSSKTITTVQPSRGKPSAKDNRKERLLLTSGKRKLYFVVSSYIVFSFVNSTYLNYIQVTQTSTRSMLSKEMEYSASPEQLRHRVPIFS
jgi:hypothetical protein